MQNVPFKTHLEALKFVDFVQFQPSKSTKIREINFLVSKSAIVSSFRATEL